MTLAEINTIILNDTFFNILNRLVDFSNVPEDEQHYTVDPNEEKTMYERITLHISLSKPTLVDFDAELILYKEELTVIEQARLDEIARKEDLKSRFNNLTDMRLTYHNLHNEPNPAKWFKILLTEDSSIAESKMVELEIKDVELAAIEVTKQQEKDAKKTLKQSFKEKLNDQITLDELKDMVKSLID